MTQAPDALKHGTISKSGSIRRTTSPILISAGGLSEPDPPIPAPHSLDITGEAKLMDHLHQVILGYAITVRDIRNRRQPIEAGRRDG